MASREGRRRGGRPAPDDWLTLGQAAKYLGVAQSTMRKWTDSGRVSTFKTPGGHRRYRRSELDQFLDRSGRVGGGTHEGRPRVLIVDDDPRLREYVRVNLEAEGYDVREAGSASEGLRALEEESPDLILLDVMMPKVDGWEMLRRVQERHGVGSIPVIMFRGHPIDWAAEALSEIGSFGIVWLVGIAIYAVVARRPRALYATALAVLLAEVSSGLLKELFERDRPFVVEPLPEPIARQPATYSFPSGHATVSFAAATVVAARVPRLAVPAYALAAAIAWSRVVVGVHYPLDVLAGAALGVAIGALVTALPRLRAALRRSAPPPPPA